MNRAALIALVLFASPAAAQVTVVGEIKALQAKVAALEAAKAASDQKVVTLTNDVSLLIGRHDILLRYLLIQACAANARIPTWATTLTGLQPFPLGNHACPPAGSRFYVPEYLSSQGPQIPPAQ